MTTAVGSTTATTATTGTAADLAAGQKNLSTGYTTFLSLLTTQLKNQDPTSPLDTNQFTQQLVQMTGVQQQLLSNQLLQSLVDQSSGSQGVTGAVGLIGKTVDATSSTATLTGGKAAWEYNLGAAASTATLTVSDASGKAIWTGSAPDLSSGSHGFHVERQDQRRNPDRRRRQLLPVGGRRRRQRLQDRHPGPDHRGRHLRRQRQWRRHPEDRRQLGPAERRHLRAWDLTPVRRTFRPFLHCS